MDKRLYKYITYVRIPTVPFSDVTRESCRYHSFSARKVYDGSFHQIAIRP